MNYKVNNDVELLIELKNVDKLHTFEYRVCVYSPKTRRTWNRYVYLTGCEVADLVKFLQHTNQDTFQSTESLFNEGFYLKNHPTEVEENEI